jgi:multidrug efflux pump subunit AcrA (membrane-fusion protein)
MTQRNKTVDGQRTEASGEVALPVRLTSPRDWLAAIVVAAVVIGGCVWGTTAELSRSVDAGGVITSPQGAFPIQTPYGGQITEMTVRPGDRVARGTRIAKVVNESGQLFVVRSPAAGRVFSVAVQVGEVVPAGKAMMSAEHRNPDDRPSAVLFVPATVPVTLKIGTPIQLTVPSAPRDQYGVLQGRVKSVDPLLSTRKEIADFVGDSDIAAAVGATGSGRRVVVELLPSPKTVSGYKWSTATGPPFTIGSRTMVIGTLPQPPERPIEWVIPK